AVPVHAASAVCRIGTYWRRLRDGCLEPAGGGPVRGVPRPDAGRGRARRGSHARRAVRRRLQRLSRRTRGAGRAAIQPAARDREPRVPGRRGTPAGVRLAVLAPVTRTEPGVGLPAYRLIGIGSGLRSQPSVRGNRRPMPEKPVSSPAVPSLNRRDWLRNATGVVVGSAALGMALPACSSGSSQTSSGSPARTGGVRGPAPHAIVETTSGRVRGFVRNGVYIFRGIPYGDTTAGANRFQPAKKPQPWTGVRSSTSWGPVCPQAPRGGWVNDEGQFLYQWDDGFPG